MDNYIIRKITRKVNGKYHYKYYDKDNTEITNKKVIKGWTRSSISR